MVAHGNTDIVEGNLKLILGLVWSLILRYQIGRTNFPPKKLMLAWLRAVLPDLQVSNFTTDWNSGMALRHHLGLSSNSARYVCNGDCMQLNPAPFSVGQPTPNGQQKACMGPSTVCEEAGNQKGSPREKAIGPGVRADQTLSVAAQSPRLERRK
ncbi:hypothetical protein HPB51_001986 [Rhipicephalus microplus]|uniref:Uncharacterized protein n=1 Tax=Rhipicephalus microplus TaxID=6941 RepID=A0A9J6EWQ0_RHIMP|nr:hypothetical protein HPB51_001986 [Rhipicephalus microplus]